MLKYAKAIVGAVGAGAAFLIPALADGSITGAEWIGIIAAIVTGPAIAGVRNRPGASAPSKSSVRDLP